MPPGLTSQSTTKVSHLNPTATQLDTVNQENAKSCTSINPIMHSTSNINFLTDGEVKLSRRRWLILAAFSIFGLAIALTDITSPILELFLKLMDLDIQEYLYLQPLFYYIMMVLAFPTALFVDKFGIKIAMRISAGLFVLDGFLRAVMYYPDFPYHESLKLPCYIASSMIGVEMMTIFFLLPLKVSETWFSASERTVAWAFMASQVNLGFCIASFLYPRLVTTTRDFKILAYVNVVCVLITALTSLLLVTRSEPKYPPSERVAKSNKETPKSFRQSIVKMLKHRDIVVHLIHLAIFESLTLCIGSVLQPILKSIGYSEIFAGNLMSINSLITIVMQINLAFFVDGVKNPTLICKLGSFAQGLLFVVYMLTIILEQPSWILISFSIILTLCKSWVTPNFTNMTAHLACGTVSQATVVGFSMFLTVLVMSMINLTFSKLISTSNLPSASYEKSLIFLSMISVVNELFYQAFFYGRPAKNSDEEEDEQRGLEEESIVIL